MWRSHVVSVRGVRRVVAALRHHRRLHSLFRSHVHVGLLLRLMLLQPVQVIGSALFAAVCGFPFEWLPLSRIAARSPGHRHQHDRLRGVRLALHQMSEAAVAGVAPFGRVRVAVPTAASDFAVTAVRTLYDPETDLSQTF